MAIETPRPEYMQVADAIRRAIEAGEWAPGSLIPPEPELAARYGTTRATVNRALSVLRAEGLVRPKQGRGTTVRELPVLHRDAARRQRREVREEGHARDAFEGELRALGYTARSDVTVTEVPAPAAVAELLGVDEGAMVLARRREMYANDLPVQMATSYIPLDIAAGTPIAETDTGAGGRLLPPGRARACPGGLRRESADPAACRRRSPVPADGSRSARDSDPPYSPDRSGAHRGSQPDHAPCTSMGTRLRVARRVGGKFSGSSRRPGCQNRSSLYETA